jgi:MYXO-CTERM domain-containing protein
MWPAELQTLLGNAYNVVNDGGDTNGTVLRQTDYCATSAGDGPADPVTTGAENGAHTACAQQCANAPLGCYLDSKTADIVVIGPFAEHDYRVVDSCLGADPNIATEATFEAAYEALVSSYLAITPTPPEVYVTTPILLPNLPFSPTVAPKAEAYITNVILPAVRAVAANHHLPVVDLYTAFLDADDAGNNGTYFKGGGDGQTNPAGEQEIANLVAASIMGGYDAGGAASGASSGTSSSGSAATGAGSGSGTGSSAGLASGTSAGGSGGTGAESGSAGGSGSTGTGGASGTSGSTSGTQAASGSVTPTSGTTATGGATSGTNAASGAEATSPKSSSGCSFSLTGVKGPTWGAALGLLALGFVGLARRRRS